MPVNAAAERKINDILLFSSGRHQFMSSFHTAQGIAEIFTDKILQRSVFGGRLFQIINNNFSSAGKPDHIPLRKTDKIHKPFRVEQLPFRPGSRIDPVHSALKVKRIESALSVKDKLPDSRIARLREIKFYPSAVRIKIHGFPY